MQFQQIGEDGLSNGFECKLGLFSEASSEYATVRQEIHDVARWCEANSNDHYEFLMLRDVWVEYRFGMLDQFGAFPCGSEIGVFAKFQDEEDSERFLERWVKQQSSSHFVTPKPSTKFDGTEQMQITKPSPGYLGLQVGKPFVSTSSLTFESSGWTPTFWYEIEHRAKQIAEWCKAGNVSWNLRVKNPSNYRIEVKSSGKVMQNCTVETATLYLRFEHEEEAMQFQLSDV